jgi:hypothetical protein
LPAPACGNLALLQSNAIEPDVIGLDLVVPSGRAGISRWPALAVMLAALIASDAAAAPRTIDPDNLHGSATVRVTEEGASIERFDQKKFPDFAQQTLARYFKLGNKVAVVARASAQRGAQDIELVGPSRCLATTIDRAGWQKLRFEFTYRIDDAYLIRTADVRFEILVRIISGETADFSQNYEPPADRYKQIAPAELTDLATKLAGFMRMQMSSACFNKRDLEYCPTGQPEPCQ